MILIRNLLVLSILSTTTSIFSTAYRWSRVQQKQHHSSVGWTLDNTIVQLRAGDDSDIDGNKDASLSPSKASGVNNSRKPVTEESEDEEYDSTDEEEDEEEEEEEEDTLVEDIMEEEEEENWTEEGELDNNEEDNEEEDEVSLSEVLMDQQQQQEEELSSNNANSQQGEDEKVVGVLEDGLDIDVVTSSLPASANTDDDESMDKDDAYDEDLLVEDQEEELTTPPVLVTGDDNNEEEEEENNNQTPSSNENNSDNDNPGSAPQEIAPVGAGTDDDDAESVEASDTTVTAAATTTASANLMTKEMKQALEGLRWTKREIKFMRPDVAAGAIHKQLIRPREGMPATWYIDGKLPSPSSSRSKVLLGKIVKLIVVPVCVVAAAMYAGSEVNWDECSEAIQRLPSKISMPKLPTLPVKKPTVTATQEEEPAQVEEEEDKTEEDETEEMMDHHEETHPKDPAYRHVHSVKPFSKEADDELDETWLDKLITKFERAVKAIFTKEL